MKFIPFGIVKVTGTSMLPTLPEGAFVLVSSLPYLRRQPQVNDVVLITQDTIDMVKRVQSISNDQYFVVGDNRLASTDSRQFGSIKRNHIKAKVIKIL